MAGATQVILVSMCRLQKERNSKGNASHELCFKFPRERTSAVLNACNIFSIAHCISPFLCFKPFQSATTDPSRIVVPLLRPSYISQRQASGCRPLSKAPSSHPALLCYIRTLPAVILDWTLLHGPRHQ